MRRKIHHNQFLGLLLIAIGAAITFIAAGEFLLRLLVVCFGLYLIYQGLIMRDDRQVLFYIHRFQRRF